MNWFESSLQSVNTFMYSYLLIVLLVVVGVFFTIKTKFIQFRLIPDMFKLLTEKSSNDQSGKKEYRPSKPLRFRLLLESEQET